MRRHATCAGCDTVKKRKRKLSEAQRLALVRRVLQRSAKDILYMGKIARNKDDPRAVAKYLSAELFACPARGGALVRPDNRVRWNEQGFVARRPPPPTVSWTSPSCSCPMSQ
jgi:hypothetical protein